MAILTECKNSYTLTSFQWDYLATVVRVPVFSYQWDYLATAVGVPVFSYQWVAPDNTGIQSE
jgi:hypothetical protein